MTDSPAPPQLRAIHRQLPLATLRVISALMLRELGATYGRRPGGFLWMFIEPVAGVALLAIIFTSVGFRTPALGTNFAIFYATGLMPYYMFVKISGRMGSALGSSRALLAYPRVTLIDVLAAKLILHTLIQATVTAIILGGLRAYFDTGTRLLLDRVVLGLTMAAALGAGVGVMNCFLSTRFVLYRTFWNILTRPAHVRVGRVLPDRPAAAALADDLRLEPRRPRRGRGAVRVSTTATIHPTSTRCGSSGSAAWRAS
jgi:capsular polysaccharide transport system permease protein